MFFRSKKNAETQGDKETTSASAGAGTPASSTPASATPPAIPKAGAADAQAKKAGKAYSRGLLQAFGSVVAVFCRSKSHRARALSDIEQVVSPAVMSGQFVLAEATHEKNGLATPVAAVLWASVSDAVDRRLSSGEPTRLQPSEWKSGNIVWIVDAVGDTRMLNAMVKRLREKQWKGRLVKVRAKGTNGKFTARVVQAAAS
ncbi:MAG: toxin-activating lysine-acyltransferase [Hyphomicrobium sp.]|uniref:toxin-activating lysine-acyltransferase n=1 Tax=Hyphomicrobium sp. TaxID=82 RepID=UPI003D109249